MMTIEIEYCEPESLARQSKWRVSHDFDSDHNIVLVHLTMWLRMEEQDLPATIDALRYK